MKLIKATYQYETEEEFINHVKQMRENNLMCQCKIYTEDINNNRIIQAEYYEVYKIR